MSTAQEFKNDLIHCIINPKPDCVVELEVTANKEFIEKSQHSALFAITKQATVPGYHRGKAPTFLVQSTFPKEVEKAIEQFLAKKAWEESKNLIKFSPLNGDDNVPYRILNTSPESTKIFFSFEVNPHVPVINPDLLSLNPVERPNVTESQVNETVRQALFFYAQWEPITDRPIQEGDFVTLDVDVIETDPASTLFKDTRFEVTDKSMAQWMKQAILGKNLNDVVEAISVPDADVSEQEKELFPPQKVKITIKAVEKAILPVVTKELAQKMGALSEKDLYNKVEKQLNDQADASVVEKNKEQIILSILENHPFPLPKSLIESGMANHLNLAKKDPQFAKYWEPLSEDQKKKVLSLMAGTSERSIRLFFLAMAFCRAQGVPFPEAGQKQPNAQQIVDSVIDYLTATTLHKNKKES